MEETELTVEELLDAMDGIVYPEGDGEIHNSLNSYADLRPFLGERVTEALNKRWKEVDQDQAQSQIYTVLDYCENCGMNSDDCLCTPG